MTTNEISTNREREVDSSNAEDGSLESIAVTYGHNVYQEKGVPRSLADAINEIRSSETLREATERLRSADSKQRDQLKKRLPWIAFQRFHNLIRKKSKFQDTKYLVLDLDGVTDPEALRKSLINDPDVFIVYKSPSGTGLRVIYELEVPVTTWEHYRRLHRYYARLFEDNYEVSPDDCGSKATQIWFIAHDPHISVNLLHDELEVIDTEDTPAPNAQELKALGLCEGSRNNALMSLVGSLNRNGLSMKAALSEALEWNKNNIPPLENDEVERTVTAAYQRYSNLPVKIHQKDGYSFKRVRNGKSLKSVQIATFSLEPKELLVLPDGDCLRCNVVTSRGYAYENVLIENTDWLSKAKFLRAIGHQDCTFVGSETDVQGLCAYVNEHVEIRKTGTKTIGLMNDTWITEGSNITVSGLVDPPTIVPYDKGADAFYHKIGYPVLSDVEYLEMARGFYDNILSVNTAEVILPWLGWSFVSPLKPKIQEVLNGFPAVFVHGAQGSGKTSTAFLLMKLLGYKDPKPSVVTMRPFPTLKLLSATNAIPVFLDEYKVSQMTQDQRDNLHSYLRKAYNAEVETKGHADQTTSDYVISAPMVVMGEWDINEPALKERMIVVRFTAAAKTDKGMQNAYKALHNLALQGFMPRYIQYVLGQNLEERLESARKTVETCFAGIEVAPRTVNNLSVMVLGLELFQSYTDGLGIEPPEISYDTLLKSQLKEITGSESGMVRSAVDQLIEELGFMWQKNEKQIVESAGFEPKVKQVPWWKRAVVDDKSVVAIRFSKVFPEFKEYAKRTDYEGELLDKSSYQKLFDETSYVFKKDHPVDFEGKKYRCLCIEIAEAKQAGIDLEGFGIEA